MSLITKKTSWAGFQEGEQKLVRPRDLSSQLFHGPPHHILLTKPSHKPHPDSKGEEANSTAEGGTGKTHHIVWKGVDKTAVFTIILPQTESTWNDLNKTDVGLSLIERRPELAIQECKGSSSKSSGTPDFSQFLLCHLNVASTFKVALCSKRLLEFSHQSLFQARSRTNWGRQKRQYAKERAFQLSGPSKSFHVFLVNTSYKGGQEIWSLSWELSHPE